MELADPRMIAELLQSAQRPQRRNAKRSEPQPDKSAFTARPPKVRECRCGKCSRCVENARWNRIFSEKFEDPGYYDNRMVRFVSPLG